MSSKSLPVDITTFWKISLSPLAGAALPERLPLTLVTGGLTSGAQCTWVEETKDNCSRRWDEGKPGLVLSTALEPLLCSALGWFAASSLAMPHSRQSLASPQPWSSVSKQGLTLLWAFALWVPCAGIPTPLFPTWGTSVHLSGLSSNVTFSGKPSPLLRKDGSFVP